MEPEPVSPRAPWWKYPVGLVAVLAPLLFIWKVDVGLAGGEYELNTWFIAYNGEYLRAHHAFPSALHTSREAGAAAPLFYGYLLFKVGGLLSLIGGAHLAVRLIVVFCCAAVYLSVRHALRAFRATEGLATGAACAVCWAVYPLTNLYNRFAFAEFFAAACLTCSCCLWAVFFLRPRRATGWFTALTAGFFLTLAAGSHPITGMLSIPFLVLVYLLQWTVPAAERPDLVRRHAALLLSAALAALVLAPWLFAYAKLGKELAFCLGVWRPGLAYFEGGAWASAAVRLSPIPVDYRHLYPDSPPVGVGHLDTQINLPLLIAALGALAGAVRVGSWARLGRLGLVLGPIAVLGLLAFTISIYRTGFGVGPDMQFPRFPSFLWKVQFGYRLVAVVNLSVLLGLLATVAYHRVAAPGRVPRVGLAPFALGIVVTLAVTGLLVKLVHGRASVSAHYLPLRHSDPGYQRWLVSQPFTASRDYITPRVAPVLPDAAVAGVVPAPLPVGTGPEFGRPLPLRVSTDRPEYAGTQVLPFKWCTFRVDGEPVPPDQLRLWHDLRSGQAPSDGTLRVAVPVTAGEHVVEYAWEPPRMWAGLNALSPCVLVGWFAVLVVAPAVGRVTRGRTVRPVGEPPGADVVPIRAPLTSAA
jgi:hypothetical protein